MSEESLWIIARYGGKCKECGEPVYEGDMVLWTPGTRTVLCEACGKEEEAA